MDLWGLVGYECFGQVVLPHGLSETFDVGAPDVATLSSEHIVTHEIYFS